MYKYAAKELTLKNAEVLPPPTDPYLIFVCLLTIVILVDYDLRKSSIGLVFSYIYDDDFIITYGGNDDDDNDGEGEGDYNHK